MEIRIFVVTGIKVCYGRSKSETYYSPIPKAMICAKIDIDQILAATELSKHEILALQQELEEE